MVPNRRQFCSQAAALFLTPGLYGQSPTAPAGGSTARPNVAVIDHDRILALAATVSGVRAGELAVRRWMLRAA